MANTVFPYRPTAPILVRWQWTTDLIEAKAGGESVRAVRDVPRQRWEWRLVVDERQVTALLRGHHSSTYRVPAWHEAEQLAGPVLPGATSVPADTTVGDWRSYILLWAAADQYELIAIDSVGAGVINLSTPVVGTYAAGDTLAAVREARLDATVRLQSDRQIMEWRCIWLIQDAIDLGPYDWPVQYQEADVLTDLYLLERDTASRSMQAAATEYDYQTGDVGYEIQYERDVWQGHCRHMTFTPADAWTWVQWLHKTQGRAGSFFLSTQTSDIVLAAPFSDTDRWVTIQNVGYDDHLASMRSNKLLYFQRHAPHAPLLRYIVDSLPIDADTEQIQLDTALGFSGVPASFPVISWCLPARLQADQIELLYEPGQMTLTLPVRERVVNFWEIDPDPSEFEIALYVAITGSYADDYKVILEALGWTVTIYMDGTLPAPGAHTFDIIWAEGFDLAQAANGALLDSYQAAGVPILIGCSGADLTSHPTSLLAELGLATSSSSNSSFTVDPSFHQIADHEILNGTTQDEATGTWSITPRADLPQAVTTRANCYGKKDYILDDASPVGTPLAYGRIPTPIPGGQQAISLLAVDNGVGGFTSRILFSGHLPILDVVNMGADAKALLHNELKWLLSAFSSFETIPVTWSGLETFASGAVGSEWFGATVMISQHLSTVDPPDTWSGQGMEITGTGLSVYKLADVSGDWEFHCQWIYRDAAFNNRVGFGFNLSSTHQDGSGNDILEGYTYTLDNVDGWLLRWWAEFVDPVWVQRSTVLSSTTQDWDEDILVNFEMQYKDNLWQLRTWNEGAECPPGPFGAGGTLLTDHVSGVLGAVIELGNPTAKMELSNFRVAAI